MSIKRNYIERGETMNQGCVVRPTIPPPPPASPRIKKETATIVDKVICPLNELQEKLTKAKAQIALMKPVVDTALEWIQAKDGSFCYPEYVGESLKNRYMYGMCIEMDLYNAAMKYKKRGESKC